MSRRDVERERRFGRAAQFPRQLPPEVVQAKIEQATRLMQQVESNYVGARRIEIPVLSTQPFDLILWGDLHLLSLSTDADQIDLMIKWILGNPNAIVFGMGDELEGIKRAYERTNRTPGTYQQQEDVLALKFEPLAASGQLIGFLRDYWGHPGWSDTGVNADPWLRLSRQWGVPQLMNGGELVFKWEDGKVWKTMLWHNPPGGSKVDPVGGLRQVSLATDVSRRMGLYANAHTHQQGTGSELQPGDDTERLFMSVGTNKGSNDDLPADGFGVRLGKGNMPTSRAGQGVVVYRSKNSREGVRGVPFSTMKRGDQLGTALRIADRLISQGLDEELIAGTLAKKKEPKLTRQPGSVLSSSPYLEDADLVRNEAGGEEVVPDAEYSATHDTEIIPPYERLKLKPNDTSSPLAVMVHSNVRAGSSSGGMEALREFRDKNVADNPLVLELWLRNLLDRDAGMRPGRQEILDELVEILQESDGRGVGLLLDKSLRRKAWLRHGKKEEPVIPASYLASESGIALLQNRSIVDISMGRGLVYPIGVVDELMNSGSTSNPAFGLLQMYTKHFSTKPAVIVGGHMPAAGWAEREDRGNPVTDYPVVIQPGSYAKTFDGLGGGNKSKGAKPGQGFFMMPGERQSDAWVVPFGDEGAFRDLFTALVLYDEIVRKGSYPRVRKDLERMGIILKK